MSRSLFLLAVYAVGVLSARPAPQPFPQPLVFETNRGQAQSQATWIAQGPGYQLEITHDAAIMAFRKVSNICPGVENA